MRHPQIHVQLRLDPVVLAKDLLVHQCLVAHGVHAAHLEVDWRQARMAVRVVEGVVEPGVGVRFVEI